MGLREELRNITPEQAMLALFEQIGSDSPDAEHGYMDRARWYSDLLQDYPALERVFKEICTVAIGVENGDENSVKAVITGAGIGLLAVKAIANKQVFEGLEAPPDLED